MASCRPMSSGWIGTGGLSDGPPTTVNNGAGRRPESPLLRLLESQRRRASLTRKALAARLGLSPAYLSQLLSHDRPLESLSMAAIRRCAGFLGIPVVICLVLAGRLTPADFLSPSDVFATALATALATVAGSRWGLEAAVTPAQLQALPLEVQLLMVRLAEQADGVVLLPGRLRAADYERVFAYCAPDPE